MHSTNLAYCLMSDMRLMRRSIASVALALLGCRIAMASPLDVVGACAFKRDDMQFQGSAQEQAACLLRTVLPWGRVEPTQAALPEGLRQRVDQPMAKWKSPLRQYLAQQGLSERDLGGSLDAPLSAALRDDGVPVQARYFVIHDTSWPFLDAQDFPREDDAHLNDLGAYAHPSTALAHVFVNRIGQAFTAHTFDEPWRATKLEMRAIGLAAKGLFLHVELVQPRRRDTSGPTGNDALAPKPGFTEAQYDMLALLYLAASVRAGHGLVPALHAAVDDGLADGHDDPQNFQLSDFNASLTRLEARLALLTTALTPTN